MEATSNEEMEMQQRNEETLAMEFSDSISIRPLETSVIQNVSGEAAINAHCVEVEEWNAWNNHYEHKDMRDWFLLVVNVWFKIFLFSWDARTWFGEKIGNFAEDWIKLSPSISRQNLINSCADWKQDHRLLFRNGFLHCSTVFLWELCISYQHVI